MQLRDLFFQLLNLIGKHPLGLFQPGKFAALSCFVDVRQFPRQLPALLFHFPVLLVGQSDLPVGIGKLVMELGECCLDLCDVGVDLPFGAFEEAA
ncbi:hypothetical protein GCM10011487_63600 [Steroidobacter agaridevorans]|uniref:Uncharacterized protein n=1 Tax=Steroidobacter agaridevorans TaxID=2695856 RepID=A0A829YM87_9GAMM|nr:hypothetical protein GCM10011487_63600 [Steroidobacter agaridevorans]